jgi:hypothetical protein
LFVIVFEWVTSQPHAPRLPLPIGER